MTKNIGLLLACLMMMAPPLLAAKSPAVLFQDAMIKETGERDPEAAIGLYKKVIDAPGTERDLKVRASFRMAGCYELLGQTKEAEQVYTAIIAESSTVSSDEVQEALSNLRRLQAQEKPASVPQKPLVLRSQYRESRYSLSIGGATFPSAQTLEARGSVALRARILPGTPPLALFIEAGALTPGEYDQMRSEAVASVDQTTDLATMILQYQAYLAFIAELPHGHERWVIPEGGVGVAFTSTKIEARSTLSQTVDYSDSNDNAEATKTSINPYFSAGLHFFPDHIVSMLFQGSYVACPSPGSVQLPTVIYYTNNGSAVTTTTVPTHSQTFSFPSSYWGISLKLQIKFGSSKLVLEQKS